MNYKYCYDLLVSNRKQLGRTKKDGVYYERHHIPPRSLGGTNNPENLVYLTPKEHYICHHLLTKFTIGSDKIKMVFAWKRIAYSKNSDFIPAKQYEYFRKLTARAVSVLNKEQGRIPPSWKGKKRSAENCQRLSRAKTGIKPTAETKQRMSLSRKGVSPWNSGQTGLCSIETRRRMSEAAKNRTDRGPLTEEHKDKLRNKIVSAETRKRLSDAAKNRKPASEETKNKIRETLKTVRTTEILENLSQKSKAAWKRGCYGKGKKTNSKKTNESSV